MPYNSPMKKKGSSCMQMKNHKGKPSGLMMEGSVAHQESEAQEVVNLETKNPVADKASAMEMSPYKMGHESPAKMGHKDSPMHDNHPGHEKDERSGRGRSITEGIDLSEATASLSDMYKRDANMKIPAFPEFTTTSSGYTQVGSEGSIEPFPSAVYIGKGTSIPGVGRTFSKEEISAGREKYEDLARRKKIAQDYLAANM